jgi:hypothetical protein
MMERFCSLRAQIGGQSAQLAEPGREKQQQEEAEDSSKAQGSAGAVDASAGACPGSSMQQPAERQQTYLQLKRTCAPGYYGCWDAMLQAEAMATWLRKPVHLQQFI